MAISFGTELKVAREFRQVSQYKLAKEVNVSRAMICRIEKGERLPSDKTLESICDYLHIDKRTWLRKKYGQDAAISNTVKQMLNES